MFEFDYVVIVIVVIFILTFVSFFYRPWKKCPRCGSRFSYGFKRIETYQKTLQAPHILVFRANTKY